MTASVDEDFRQYVAARSGALFRTAYALTGNRADAEDLLQTALAKVYLSWDRIREREALDAYVRRVMVNSQIGWWRRRKVTESLTDQVPEQPTGNDVGAQFDLHDAMWRAVRGLPARQRTMVVLRFYEDLSDPEIADLLGVSAGTVRSSISRALSSLRDVSDLADAAPTTGRVSNKTSYFGAAR